MTGTETPVGVHADAAIRHGVRWMPDMAASACASGCAVVDADRHRFRQGDRRHFSMTRRQAERVCRVHMAFNSGFQVQRP
ncbi:MAG: hypothetical protein RBT51_06035 [Ectothiorhodospiraceae bacterium]|jgi:hypothetical protein|nr:hypothetical protein [Ectothiorhodospiraceae bacterium]